MDISTSEEELDTSLESISSEVRERTPKERTPHRPSPFTLRSQCACPTGQCPFGTGIQFRSRISPSPSKQRVRSRRRRRSNQNRLNTSDATNTSASSSFLEISHDSSIQEPHSHHQHLHHHGQSHPHYHHHHHDSHLGVQNIDHHHHHHRVEETLEQRLAWEKFVATPPPPMRQETRVSFSPSNGSPVQQTVAGQSTDSSTTPSLNGSVGSLAESVKNSVLSFITPTKEAVLPAIVESSESGFEDGSVTGNAMTVVSPSPSQERFIPAREFFAKADARRRLTSDYFSGSDTPSKVRESTKRLSIRKPYNKYIAYSSDEELDEWQEQPKSNYTYSESLTYRERVTPDRKIGSPNMSRRSLRGGDIGYAQSRDFSAPDFVANDTDDSNLTLRSRIIPRLMDALSDTSDGEEEIQEKLPIPPRMATRSRSRSIEIMPRSNGSITRTFTSSTISTTRILHHGLDAESDVDDGTESFIPGRAVPLTAYGRPGTPLGRETTPLPRAGTPQSRASTPLGRAKTPIDRPGTPYHRDATPFSKIEEESSVLEKSTLESSSFASSAIAKDLEEEEKTKSPVVVTWSRKTWQNVVRITTLITTAIVMSATTAVTRNSTNNSKVYDGEEEESAKSEKWSFVSSMNTTRTRITTTVSEFFESTRERAKKNPIYLWIPLLIILLLLALVAYWWLLLSRAKAGGATDPTETDAPSYLALFLAYFYSFTSWVFSSISSAAVSAWESTLYLCTWIASATIDLYTWIASATIDLYTWIASATIDLYTWIASATLDFYTWIASACYTGLASARTTAISMSTWLGSVAHTCLAYLLHFLYLILGFLEYLFWAVYNFLSSALVFVSGIFLPPIGTDEGNSTSEEVTSWSIIAWASDFSLVDHLSEWYSSTSHVVQTSGNWLWTTWLWLILTVGEFLSAAAGFISWLLTSLWSVILYALTGVWSFLTDVFVSLFGFLASVGTSVSSVAVQSASSASNSATWLLLPFFQWFKSTATDPEPKIVLSAPSTAGSTTGPNSERVLDIVEKVLASEKLKVLIESAALETSSKNQVTAAQVSEIVKLAVEGELSVLRAEASSMKADLEVQSEYKAEGINKYILSLQQQQENLIQQLQQIGAGLSKLEGMTEVDRSEAENQKKEYEAQLLSLKEEIGLLETRLHELQANHSNLAMEVKGCCKNTSLTLADVERHVTLLLSDILGLPGIAGGVSGDGTGGSLPLSAREMGGWLKSYFVAKEELETRLNNLMATMQVKTVGTGDEERASRADLTAATVAQSTQIVMETVLENLRAELQKEHIRLAEQTEQMVGAQVKTQVEAAAGVLGQQVSEQVQHHLLKSTEGLVHSVNVAVDDAVQKTVPEHVESVVSEKISGAVDIAVAGAVDTAVRTVVDTTIPETVDVAVSKKVDVAVSGAVSKAVAAAVPEKIAVALPDAVNEAVIAAVPAAVANAIPGVVTTLLPAAVNETVSAAVTEAIGVSVNKAGDTNAKVLQNIDEMVVAAGGTSSSTNSDGAARVSATVNMSHSNNGSNFSFVPGGIPLVTGLNESAVIRIVKEALLKYDADKTGMVDHALETAGGNIISTRCTESYQVHQAEVSILGFPIYRYSTNNPRTIIQPDCMPGQCWAFKGSQGYIVIQLAGFVRPTAFTFEHIPKSLSPTGNIDSAPREFEVWGLQSENDEGVRLGSYMYDEDGEPLQSFPVQEDSGRYFPMVELKINSNHGNLQYTCLYRFRVHGLRQ